MNNMKYLRMDLKVCEGCGTLWLRTITSNGVYCRSCATRLSEFPAPRGRSRAGRKPRDGRKPGLARINHCNPTTRCNQTESLAGGAR
jgi:hypothetical protein